MIFLHKFEKIWLIFGVSFLMLFLTIVGINAFHSGNHPAGSIATLDPEKINETPPFDNPGVVKVDDDHLEVNIIAQIFSYVPNKIVVPVGKEVTFRVISRDVVHSFSIIGTNVNMMAVPGNINERTTTFTKPGNYLIICNEYCGSGHQQMKMEIEVVE